MEFVVEEEEEDPEEPEEISEDEDDWESDDEEILEEDPVVVVPDIMDLDFDSNDVPPPPVEDDIGPYKAQLPSIF
ncbi:hypothetical protein RHMOL_Rhmol03G0110100 [Rhododendron molle]|uniref:Uncharacterized protein n=1 Tax=Rhododendron molle TaxID=49168 RepID=A0ACC0PE58_RHOML|nr:hypothetical protein RHMOL_Rhmol03G0110100 [Rhododendron molle]